MAANMPTKTHFRISSGYRGTRAPNSRLITTKLAYRSWNPRNNTVFGHIVVNTLGFLNGVIVFGGNLKNI